MKKSEVEQEQIKIQEMFNKELLKRGQPIEDFKIVAVGYLDITEKYKKGIVSQNFINKLKMVWNEGLTLGSMGHHTCEFCEGEEKATSSSEKVLIDRKNNIKYIFPEMIFHYIEKHNYMPPEDFIFFILRRDL